MLSCCSSWHCRSRLCGRRPSRTTRRVASRRCAAGWRSRHVSLDTRYRFTADNQDALSANQLQYRESIKARFNLDPGRRYTVNVGYFTGNSFVSAWDNWGVGNSTAFDGTHNYLKQLYASATPARGLVLQYRRSLSGQGRER